MHHWQVLRGIGMARRVDSGASICMLRRCCDLILLLKVIEIKLIIVSTRIQRHRSVTNLLGTPHTVPHAPLCCESRGLSSVWDTPLLIRSSSLACWVRRLIIGSSRVKTDRNLAIVQLSPWCKHILRLIFNLDRTHSFSKLVARDINNLIALQISIGKFIIFQLL